MSKPPTDSLAEALRLLRRARDARARGGDDVPQCLEYAEGAHTAAQGVYFSADDAVTMGSAVEVMYQARACPGRMYRFRGEHELAFSHYRGALAVVEEYATELKVVQKWLGPAYHDCFVEARLCGYAPPEFCNWASRRMETQNRDDRMFAFVHDLAYLRAAVNSCEPKHLWTTALGSTFHTEDAFERMLLYANMCLAAGQMQSAQWFGRAVQRFDSSVERMEHEEGVALALLDVAGGAFALGERDAALARLQLAERVADARDELVLAQRAHRQRIAYGLREENAAA
jgi:hypothetical protein